MIVSHSPIWCIWGDIGLCSGWYLGAIGCERSWLVGFGDESEVDGSFSGVVVVEVGDGLELLSGLSC